MSGWWFNKVVPRPCHALTNVPASMLGRWGNEIFVFSTLDVVVY